MTMTSSPPRLFSSGVGFSKWTVYKIRYPCAVTCARCASG